MIITIDGPAASGKSTVSLLLAQRLNYFYLATGMLYRALAYLLLQEYKYTLSQLRNPSKQDVLNALSKLIYTIDAQKNVIITVSEEIVTHFLVQESIGQAASLIAPHPFVREQLCLKERSLAKHHESAIVEGRDSGTTVFPSAEYKFFLHASVHVRAQRIQVDQQRRGIHSSLSDLEALLQERDHRDMTRSHGMLKQAEGSYVIDTTSCHIAEIVDKILNCIHHFSSRGTRSTEAKLYTEIT